IGMGLGLGLLDGAQDADADEADDTDGNPVRRDPRQVSPQGEPNDEDDETDQVYAERGRHTCSSVTSRMGQTGTAAGSPVPPGGIQKAGQPELRGVLNRRAMSW